MKCESRIIIFRWSRSWKLCIPCILSQKIYSPRCNSGNKPRQNRKGNLAIEAPSKEGWRSSRWRKESQDNSGASGWKSNPSVQLLRRLQARFLRWNFQIEYQMCLSRLPSWKGLPWHLSSRELASAGATGDAYLIPGSRRSPGGGNGNPLQFSHLENPMNRSLAGYDPWGCKESDTD